MSENTGNDTRKGLTDALRKIKREGVLTRYDARGQLIDKGEMTGDPLVDMFLGNEISETAYQVLKLRYTESRRVYVEACLLATDDTDKISDILEVDPEVIEVYQKVYFDVAGLDKLSKLKIVELIEEDREKNLKMWAISQGIDFVSWRLGTVPKINPVEGLTSIYSDCFFKAKEAFYNPNTAESSKEGLKWAKQATDIARLLKLWVNDSDAASDDIRIALREITGEDISFPDIHSLVDGEDASLMDISDLDELSDEIDNLPIIAKLNNDKDEKD